MRICGTILAGGKSSRMGTNKALLKINDKPVIERIADELEACTDQVIVISKSPKEYEFLHLDIFPDRYQEQGPLAGFESALYHVEADWFIIVACDMPFIKADVFRYLYEKRSSYDAVVPIYDGQMHPLSGIYHRSVLPSIQQQLNNQRRQVKSFFEHIHVHYVKEFSLSQRMLERHFFNMNHPEEYEEAETMIQDDHH